MKEIETIVSPLVEAHFPDFYKSEGPQFVEFVKAYYQWLEAEGNPLFLSRNLFNIRDIDRTSDQFIQYFTKKYIPNVPLSSLANTQFLVKHAKEIHQARGTQRGIQLVIRGLYDEDAEIYYPGKDVFKSSHGTWVKPVYLELSPSERTKTFINKQVTGSASGARAFAEGLVRRRIGGRYFDVLYISQVQGDFATGELITTIDDPVVDFAPTVTGSMTDLTVIAGGAEFNVGDIFDVVSSSGKQGKARVTEVSNQTGKVSFIFIDSFESGGWGYTLEHSDAIVSEKVLVLRDILNLDETISTFNQFETVSQNLISITYNTARPNNSPLSVGAVVENYDNSGTVVANGVIVSSNPTTTSNGVIVVAPKTGNIAVDSTFAVKGTGVSATFNANTGVNSTTDVITTTAPHTFVNNDIVVYHVATGNTVLSGLSVGAAYVVTNASSSTLQLADNVGDTAVNITASATSETGHILIKSLGSAVIVSSTDRTATGNVIGTNTTITTSTFNANNGVASATDIITTQEQHEFVVNDLIQYVVSTGNTAISGLTNYGSYYVINTTPTTLQLSLTRDGSPLGLTAGLTETGHTLRRKTGHVGVINVGSYGFVATPYANLVGQTTNTHVRVTDVSTGTDADFNVSLLTNQEQVFLYLDFIRDKNTANVVFSSINLNGNNSGAALQYGSPITLSTSDLQYGSFGFPKYSGANMDTLLFDALRYEATSIGSIAAISGINPGNDYNIDPFVIVLESWTSGYGYNDLVMNITGNTSPFIEREMIEQSYTKPAVQLNITGFAGTAANGSPTTGVFVSEFVYQSNNTTNVVASGYVLESSLTAGSGTIKLRDVTGTFVVTTNANTKIKTVASGGNGNTTSVTTVTQDVAARALVKPSSNGSTLYLKRINFENTFLAGGNPILGRSSGVTANVVSIDDDANTLPIGLNAVISANVQTANNVVTKLSVQDSGFNYLNQETVTLTSPDSIYEVTAIVKLGKQGVGSGFFSSTRGFLDADKKLHDGTYYQDYSYEVQTKVPFTEYFDVLKQLMHVAGTKMFGKVTSITPIDFEFEANSVVVSANVQPTLDLDFVNNYYYIEE